MTLRHRARLPYVFVMGYCNDYQQYFPTIQAVAEGGYGTVPPVASRKLARARNSPTERSSGSINFEENWASRSERHLAELRRATKADNSGRPAPSPASSGRAGGTCPP